MSQAVIFDLGRVLVNYDYRQVLATLEKVSQADATQIEAAVLAVAQRWGTGRLDAHTFHHYMMKETGTTSDFEQFATAYSAGQQRNDKAIAYAVSLQQQPHITGGIISNTDPLHAAWMLRHIPELQTFDALLLSHQVHLLKPDPAIFRLALDRLQVAPGQAFFIDDQEENVAGARSIGIKGVVHSSWSTTPQAIEAWLNA